MLVLVDCNLEIAVALIVMFGILTNTYCAGAVSRDGEFFFLMRTMPVDCRTVIGAKAAFCFIPSAAAAAASARHSGRTWVCGRMAGCVYILAVTLAIAAAQICFAIRRDLMRPHFGGSGGAEENATLFASGHHRTAGVRSHRRAGAVRRNISQARVRRGVRRNGPPC